MYSIHKVQVFSFFRVWQVIKMLQKRFKQF